MRLTKVTFNGYKRLGDTSCNVDGRLIAVLGPNEAGKSSVLEALAWLSYTDSGPLEGRLRSRALGHLSDKHAVVTARYALDDDDRAALADLDSDVAPRYYDYIKVADGSYQAGTEPRVTRRRQVLDDATEALASVRERFGPLPTNTAKDGIGDYANVIAAALAAGDRAPSEAVVNAFGAISDWLRQPAEVEVTDDPADAEREPYVDPDDVRLAERLDAGLVKLEEPDVAAEVRGRLGPRRPAFLLFGDDDRELASEYSLVDNSLAAAVPPALVNLLRLAGTTFAAVRAMNGTGDKSRIQTMLKQANLRLADRLQPAWRQSKLTVALDIDNDNLSILVEETTSDGAITEIAERSDGLRTFIALVCFLADQETVSDVPPVLLIDEAETHLHYDAQADLLDVLLNHVRTSKVIYTTHSPGCLPPDLGTGIRLVAPDPADRARSILKANFWQNTQAGFNPLLFAMGASAAAFSVCRSAVLAEGPSEMILLPSLLRAATGETELGYQIAPGLAKGTAELADVDVAAHVVYLADGDEAGAKYEEELLAQGVVPSRVHRLPNGHAVEDLLKEESWLQAVQTLMAEGGYEGEPLTMADLPGDAPVAKRLTDWSKRNGIQIPGKIALASYLVQDPKRITLTTPARAALKALHKQFSNELQR